MHNPTKNVLRIRTNPYPCESARKMIEMCPVCKKCHKFKKKQIFRQHARTCIPTTEDASWGAITGRVGKELRKKMKKG